VTDSLRTGHSPPLLECHPRFVHTREPEERGPRVLSRLHSDRRLLRWEEGAYAEKIAVKAAAALMLSTDEYQSPATATGVTSVVVSSSTV
jgi:hypothetical protein